MCGKFGAILRCQAPGWLLADPAVDADSDRFWEEAYVLRRAADASVACPTFLQPLASEILDCGRSLVLLRQQQTHRPR